MALSFIGSAAADAATVTIPAGHQAGDLIIIYAFRAALTAPSLPAGWTNIATGSGGATSFRIGWKIAISSADTSGTWTNTTGTMAAVYRGQATNKTPIGGLVAITTGTSASVNYNTVALKAPGTSWLTAFGAIVATTSALETPPTNMTNTSNLVGATVEYSAHNTNGIYGKGSWPATSVSVTTSAEWRSCVIEIEAEALAPINNYQFVKVGDGMSVSEKIL